VTDLKSDEVWESSVKTVKSSLEKNECIFLVYIDEMADFLRLLVDVWCFLATPVLQVTRNLLTKEF
jgi:hypothetical protein